MKKPDRFKYRNGFSNTLMMLELADVVNAENKNDCFKCPHLASVSGSTHKSCKHPSVMNPQIMFGLPVLIARGLVELEAPYGVKLLEFNPVGIKGGWCVYPINFDPIWVTCRLNIEKDKED